jgi:hypothetical protein
MTFELRVGQQLIQILKPSGSFDYEIYYYACLLLSLSVHGIVDYPMLSQHHCLESINQPSFQHRNPTNGKWM